MASLGDEFTQTNSIKFKSHYLGCIEVRTSMKSLDFDTRSAVAKECIKQLRTKSSPSPHAAPRLTASPIPSEGIDRNLGAKCLTYAGCDVYLTVTTARIEVRTVQGDKIVSDHEMHNISFASAGEHAASDCVAFVAKGTDPSKCYRADRNCFVFKCDPKPESRNSAQNVIAIIGKAFDLRFKTAVVEPGRLQQSAHRPDAKDSLSKPQLQIKSDSRYTAGPEKATQDLIDLKSPSAAKVSQRQFDAGAIIPDLLNRDVPIGNKMSNVQSWVIAASEHENNVANTTQQAMRDAQLMMQYKWFHPCLSRARAESLLTAEGSFLIRTPEPSTPKPTNSDLLGDMPGALPQEQPQPQYVLSANASGEFKHLLLCDDDGRIRTQDREFPSIENFVLHHHEGRFPIISPDSRIWLLTPVARK